MKAPANLLIAVLLLWMCGSAYYYVANIKEYDNESANTSSASNEVQESETEITITKEKITPKQKPKRKKEKERKKEISIANRTVYFEFNLNNFATDEDFQSYLSDLNIFLQKKKSNHVTLIGHTDTKGSEKVNLRIGMERAEFVKDILVKSGLNPDQINPESRGERQASKRDTDEGRSKDRRVEIIVN